MAAAREIIDWQHDDDVEVLLRRAIGLYQATFGDDPAFAAAAPGRVNLIGEHTDYNAGFVLPIAIDRHTVIVASPTGGATSAMIAADLDLTITIDLNGQLVRIPGDPANYVLGVADQFAKLGHRLPNLNAAIVSSIPVGAGLSSSAAVEVAFATILEQILRIHLDPMQKVLLCQRAEHTFPGTPCGIMDMLIVTCAVPGHALLIDCRSNGFTPIPMPSPDTATLLVFNTQVRHNLAGGEYAARRTSCASAAAKLGLPSLRDASIQSLEAAELTDTERRRASHVIAECDRTTLAAELLRTGDLTSFGDLMFASHDSLRAHYEVSCPELDVLVDAARTLRGGGGVLGARMTGGGFGGCVIVLCQPQRAAAVATVLDAAFRDRFGRGCPSFASGAVAAARVVAVPAV